MIQLISCAIALFLVFGIPYLMDKKSGERKQNDLEREMERRENLDDYR